MFNVFHFLQFGMVVVSFAIEFWCALRSIPNQRHPVVSSWSKILLQGDDMADYQAYRLAENADCNTFFCFAISFVCYSC